MNTILYVDDETINLRLFSLNLKKNYNILTASSPYEGIEILKNTPIIKIVVSDMRMPGMNGLEFIKAAQIKRPDIKYFILTGFDITNEISEAINANLIMKYFNKPFKVEEIIKTLNFYLGAE
jgi:response regulator RpfG family c-di-GMP phosphodiesterase